MPSWTKPTLDQFIIRFNARKSTNCASPKWNNCITLLPNLVENNSHVYTLHSTIRTQLPKIGQNTEWHFNTQACRCTYPLRHWTLKCTRLMSSGYPGQESGHQQLSYWTWHSWSESSHSSLPHKNIFMIFQIQVNKSAIQHKCKNKIYNGNKSLASY